MVSRVAFLLALSLASAGAEIDFTPQQRMVKFEDFPVAQTAFRDGAGVVMYNPPATWAVSGAGPQLRLTPGMSFAEALVEARPIGENAPVDASLPALKAELLQLVPKEAEKIEWEEIEPNPVMLNRHETRRLTLSYSAFSQRFKITAIVCNFADEQVRFRLTCRDNDFAKLYDAFRRSLYTWQGKK